MAWGDVLTDERVLPWGDEKVLYILLEAPY